MAEFTDELFDELMDVEGRAFSDRRNDRGGATNRGLTLGFLRGLSDADHDGHVDGDLDRDGDVDVDDVRAIDEPAARRIYLTHIWTKGQYPAIAEPRVARRVFDLEVNMGRGQAVLLAQRALRACLFDLADDGKFGPRTLAALNQAAPDQLLAALRAEHAAFYRLLLALDPTQREFARGWIARAYRP